MITAERKPISEIKEMIAPYRKVLVVGCGSCVAECAAGGEKEVGLLSSALRMDAKASGKEIAIKEMTLDRQCVYEFIDQLTDVIGQYDVVLSLACGAGVQAVAEVFPKVHIVPALNTTFLGETKEAGLWVENCRGCGDCKLGVFAAVCPVTRCAKGLFNGPCG
ncbi:MAG: zinc-finger protein, partial [Nitrospirae bacterium]|nr:zinc-finger protein [Nitrospirota bacterium]